MDSLLSNEELQQHVNNLYNFRDMYFETHGISCAKNKEEDVKQKMIETVSFLESAQNPARLEHKAEYFMWLGKCLNITREYNPKAEEALSKAVKLDPRLVEAWNHLGECYWKEGNIEAAKNCFIGANQHTKNKVSLRNLSMVLRQFGDTQEDKFRSISESVTKAKEAIQLDVQDGISWFILGNAYLSLFFCGAQKPSILQQCIKAYAQAEKDPIARSNPDLHFNRSMCYLYKGEMALALEDFQRADELDPSWDEAHSKVEMLKTYFVSVEQLIATKGNLAGKSKLKKMLSTLGPADLGPYGGGSYTSLSGKTVLLGHVPIRQLKPGSNENTVICGKVIGSISTDPCVPYTFAIIDKEESVIAVCLYNVSAGYGVKTGDSITIPEPYIMSTAIALGNGSDEKPLIAYDFVRVESPVALVVNSRKLGIDKQAPTLLKVAIQSE